MTTENYSRFIKVILKEAAEIDRTDDTKKDKDEKVKKIYIEKLNCFICYIMYALYSPELDDIEKAQYALKKFEENPFFLLDEDFYVKELVKYEGKDINDFYDSVFVHNVYWLDFELKFKEVMSEIEKIIKNSIWASDGTLISEIKEESLTQFAYFSNFLCQRGNELKAALMEAWDKNIPVSKARKYIENFLDKNECFNYWRQVMGRHNERVLKVYMNALKAINVDMLQHPDVKGKLLTEKVRNSKLSDLTLPGFVLFFIMGERNYDFCKYIRGDGENIDINILRKDANILRFSSISWLYNVFYLKHFVYFNAWLILLEKTKLTRAAARYFEKLVVELKKGIGEFKKSVDKLNKHPTDEELLESIKKYPSIKDIYELNKKVLEWIECETWKRNFWYDLEAYKNCILQEDIKVVFPKLKSENNITRGKIVGIKIDKCAPTLWNVYDKLEQFKDKMPLIDFEVKKKVIIERLNSINRSEDVEKIKLLLDELYK